MAVLQLDMPEVDVAADIAVRIAQEHAEPPIRLAVDLQIEREGLVERPHLAPPQRRAGGGEHYRRRIAHAAGDAPGLDPMAADAVALDPPAKAAPLVRQREAQRVARLRHRRLASGDFGPPARRIPDQGERAAHIRAEALLRDPEPDEILGRTLRGEGNREGHCGGEQDGEEGGTHRDPFIGWVRRSARAACHRLVSAQPRAASGPAWR